MDVTQALKDSENSLRDFISLLLSEKFGENWIDNCGVTSETIEKWKIRKITEEKRQISGVVEERLIYYANFYDLKTILKKHWDNVFYAAFGNWKTMEVWLTELEKLRDPDAHRRELLPHQKHLALGIAGEIRTRLVRYRSKRETSDDFFPRIESARDNYGNIWTTEKISISNSILTDTILRPNDYLEFVVTASDPLGEPVRYSVEINWGSKQIMMTESWVDNNTFEFAISEDFICKEFIVRIMIKSSRKHHAFTYFDDQISFIYSVLPQK